MNYENTLTFNEFMKKHGLPLYKHTSYYINVAAIKTQ